MRRPPRLRGTRADMRRVEMRDAPWIAEMLAERRRAYADAVEAARVAALSRLPDQAWREVASRARILGVKAEMLDDGARLHLEVDLPESTSDSAEAVPAEAAAS